ncbi:MAG: heparan-alpha-glucosaminide N-acetyltransferase domain-containing protein [Candidatus Omnitrophota bacterium]
MSESRLFNSVTPGQFLIKRVESIDLFKFLVLFFMIQGHLFRAYLLEPLRRTYAFQIHEVFHGMVAPGFLFSAGFAVFLSYFNKQEQYITLGKPFFKRIRRTLFLIWCGYWIHLPYLSLRKTIEVIHRKGIADVLRVDILQCIGVSVLIFTLIALLLKREKIIMAFSAVMTLLFFILPGAVHDGHIWYGIDPYLNYNVSLFPLFPWAGFLFLGVVCAYLYTSLVKKELFFKILFITGILFFPWYFVYSGPPGSKAELVLTGILNKIGGVFLLICLAYWITNRFTGKLVSIMKKSAQESLFVYIIHLFIIFNSLGTRGLEVVFNNRLTVLEALGLFLVIQFVVFLLSLLYHAVKTKHQPLWRVCFYIFWAVFLIIFIFKPY